jgi:multidrug transporter EmrE-like cation transporter
MGSYLIYNIQNLVPFVSAVQQIRKFKNVTFTQGTCMYYMKYEVLMAVTMRNMSSGICWYAVLQGYDSVLEEYDFSSSRTEE